MKIAVTCRGQAPGPQEGAVHLYGCDAKTSLFVGDGAHDVPQTSALGFCRNEKWLISISTQHLGFPRGKLAAVRLTDEGLADNLFFCAAFGVLIGRYHINNI